MLCCYEGPSNTAVPRKLKPNIACCPPKEFHRRPGLRFDSVRCIYILPALPALLFRFLIIFAATMRVFLVSPKNGKNLKRAAHLREQSFKNIIGLIFIYQ